ncbi:MAG: glycine--tRNA ligase subunit beta, partial [Armatimonadetes bacterium]|nr:glycine--tRNA ligase subunit beta [Armatimonadota bacterium]
MPDFLLEIGTEEMPASFVAPAVRQLRALVAEALAEAKLAAAATEAWRTFATPRRMTLMIPGVQERQADEVREVRGPAAAAAYDAEGRPTKAAAGFSKSQGISPDALVRRRVDDKEYVFATVAVAGQPASAVLASALPRVLGSLSFPKMMRWGAGDVRFGRPVRWIVALLDAEIVSFSFAGVAACRDTYGHRLLGPGPHAIAEPRTYERTLIDAGRVIPDADARRASIAAKVERAARAAGGRARIDAGLLEEVTYLVETPTAFTGAFDPRHLALPADILTTVMAHHQRYFPVEDAAGDLLPGFVAVRNGDEGCLDAVREGNEWVLSARLADARFFYEEDRRGRLEDRLPKLDEIVFQRDLGSMAQKTERLVRLGAWLSATAGGADATAVTRAARLCKADLTTAVVSELPELQGIMGGLYAAAHGEGAAVAAAIREHYQPRGASDAPAPTRAGALLAIADRADTLAGCLAAGHAPSGSADPFGLRRAAVGLFETIRAYGLVISLHALIEAALASYREQGIEATTKEGAAAVLAFLRTRLRAWLLEREEDAGRRGSHDNVYAVLGEGDDDAVDAIRRLDALRAFRAAPAFAATYETLDRAARIVAADAA